MAIYREFAEAEGVRPGESAIEFLTRHGVGPGEPDPLTVPKFLLLVGSPAEIPFSFQRDLAIQYCVGRLDFQNWNQYANYAIALANSRRMEVRTRPKVTLIDLCNGRDIATRQTSRYLVRPLKDWFEHMATADIEVLQGEAATSKALASTTQNLYKSDVVMFAGHGLWPRGKALEKRSKIGSIVCTDFSGQGGTVDEQALRCSLSADRVRYDANLSGCFIVCFGCYTAGLEGGLEEEHARGLEPMVAALPRRLLGIRKGALGFIGHIGVAKGYSFVWGEGSAATAQPQTLKALLVDLLSGKPLGEAFWRLSRRYAQLAALEAELCSGTKASESGRALCFSVSKARRDAAGYIALGDPAARLRSTVRADKRRRPGRV